MSVRIVYKDIAPGAAEAATVTATAYDTTRSTLRMLPFGSGNEKLYATLEPNLWLLDGTRSVYDGGVQSFWSAELTDNNGAFSAPPTITVSLSAQYTSLGISLVFGGDSFCSSINVKWYQKNNLLSEKSFTPNAMEYFCENTVEHYDKVVFTLYKTNLPRRRARIDSIVFGVDRTFLRNEIRSGSVRIVQEIDPTSRELATNTLDWDLSSKENVEYIFQFKQPVYVYDDETLYGVFYIDDSERYAQNFYEITCTDAIGVMAGDPFPDAYYSGVNAYNLAVSICTGYTVKMEESLKSKTVRGILKEKTRREALQQLCFAIGAVADTSGSESIKIFSLKTDSPREIGVNRIRTGGSVDRVGIVTAVKLTAHSYSTSGSGDSVEINGTTYYDTKSVTTITNPNATPSDKPNVIEISDATLISPSNVAEIAQRLYNQASRRNTHNLKFRLAGEQLGDYVRTTTPWGEIFTGHYTHGSVTLSGFALTDAEITGV